MEVTNGAGTAYHSGTHIFSDVHVAQSLVFCVMFSQALFVLLSFIR